MSDVLASHVKLMSLLRRHHDLRQSARSWLSSFSCKTAPSPMIGRMYFHTSIFISRRDMQGPITLNQKFLIFKNSVFKDQDFVPRFDKHHCTQNRGAAPSTPSLRGCAPPPRWVLNGWVVLDNKNRALRLNLLLTSGPGRNVYVYIHICIYTYVHIPCDVYMYTNTSLTEPQAHKFYYSLGIKKQDVWERVVCGHVCVRERACVSFLLCLFVLAFCLRLHLLVAGGALAGTRYSIRSNFGCIV